METSNYKLPTIILVDDHIVFRQGLKSLITFNTLGTVIGEASNGAEFLHLLSPPIPDLVFMDIDMPHMDGIKATQQALQIVPDLKIIVFSMYGDEEYYQKMLALGIKGYILKSTGIEAVEAAISSVMNGESYFSNLLPKKTLQLIESKSICCNEEEYQAPCVWW